jgi:hypothetical protein
MGLTHRDRARRSAIIRELSDLSRNGWSQARPCDYQPLERELEALNAKTLTPGKRG